MSDWSEQGAIPVDDAAVPNPPTVDEVMEEQRRRDDLEVRVFRHHLGDHPAISAGVEAREGVVDTLHLEPERSREVLLVPDHDIDHRSDGAVHLDGSILAAV